MTDQAPVCHISPTTAKDQPQPVNLPAVPLAQPNIQSLVTTVNALRQTILLITGQQGPRGPAGQAGRSGGGGGAKSNKAQWTEQSRTVETVKVHNKDDDTQFIEVERINHLVMKDAASGQTWTWDR